MQNAPFIILVAGVVCIENMRVVEDADPYNAACNATASDEVHPFGAFYQNHKPRRREKDAESGNRKKTTGFLFPKLYRVYSEW